jgi:hypothetical protein
MAHDVSILLGVDRHFSSQPRANTSMTIMRAPQRGHGKAAFGKLHKPDHDTRLTKLQQT